MSGTAELDSSHGYENSIVDQLGVPRSGGERVGNKYEVVEQFLGPWGVLGGVEHVEEEEDGVENSVQTQDAVAERGYEVVEGEDPLPLLPVVT